METKVVSAIATGSVAEVARELVESTERQLGGAKPALVVVMASLEQPLEELMPLMARAFEGTTVLGCTTAGEFTERGPSDASVSLFALAGDFVVRSAFASGLRADAERAVGEAIRELPRRVEGYEHRMGLLFVDSFALNGEETTLLTSMLLEEDIPLAGGASADGFRFANVSWVGCGERSGSDALAIAMIFSKRPIGIGVCHGHVPHSAPLEVTRSEGGVIYEIEGRPAWDVWEERTRESPIRARLADITKPGPDGLNGFLGIFELGLASGAEYKVRAPLIALEGGALGFACGIPEGSEIQIMESTPDLQIESARTAAERALAQLGGHPARGALVIDCACRKLLLGERLGEAIGAIAAALGDVPLAGFESYGEIALQAGDLSGFHNTTTVLLAFA